MITQGVFGRRAYRVWLAVAEGLAFTGLLKQTSI